MQKFFMIGTLAALAWASSAAAADSVSFEVATVKPSPPLSPAAIRDGKVRVEMRIDATRIDIPSTSLFRLLCMAYGLNAYQLKGPDWLDSARFDIQAKIPNGASASQIPEMLQALLTERFALTVHRDSQPQRVYALVVGKGDLRLNQSASEPAAPSGVDDQQTSRSILMPTSQGIVKVLFNGRAFSLEMPGGEIAGKAYVTFNATPPPSFHVTISGTMKTLAALLSVGAVDRPVVDMTGLSGNYEIAIDIGAQEAVTILRGAVNFLPNSGGPPRGADGIASDPSGPSIFSSLKNLGLKLEPQKAPLDLLVVDHVERTPIPN